MEWQYGVLTPDDGRTIAYGQWQDGVRWNGWLCPRFTFDVAVGIVASISAGSDDIPTTYEIRTDGSIAVSEEYDVGEWQTEVYLPDGDGMYAVGSWAWCWQTLDPA